MTVSSLLVTIKNMCKIYHISTMAEVPYVIMLTFSVKYNDVIITLHKKRAERNIELFTVKSLLN